MGSYLGQSFNEIFSWEIKWFVIYFSAIATGLNSSFEKDQDILVLPLDLLKHDTHGNLTQDVLKHFGKVGDGFDM